MAYPVRLPILVLLLAVTCCIFQSAHAQDDDGSKLPPNMGDMGGMFGNQNQVCQPFSCAKPYVPIAKWPLSINSMGCNSASGISMMSAGGGMDFKHMDHCCHVKNACYQICGSNKQACDKEMSKCMDTACEELPDSADMLDSMSEEEIQEEKDGCSKTKGIVELLSGMGGCQEFDSHQRGHCECVEKDKSAAKMERVLRNFYKKFNPDGVGKVKALVEKIDGKRAVFTKILYGLVKKYPAAIKKKVPEIPDAMKMDL